MSDRLVRFNGAYNKLLASGQYKMAMGMFIGLCALDEDTNMHDATKLLLDMQAREAESSYQGISEALSAAGFTRELILEVFQSGQTKSDESKPD